MSIRSNARCLVTSDTDLFGVTALLNVTDTLELESKGFTIITRYGIGGPPFTVKVELPHITRKDLDNDANVLRYQVPTWLE